MAKNDEKLNALLKLGMTREEALQVLADDDDIDHGEKKDFDLTPEQQKNAQKYTRTGTRKSTSGTKRPRKENPLKREIIQAVFAAVQDYDNPQITNPEKEISFFANGESFSITLTQHRKPKGE